MCVVICCCVFVELCYLFFVVVGVGCFDVCCFIYLTLRNFTSFVALKGFKILQIDVK